MSLDEVRLVGAFVTPFVAGLMVTPVAIAVATRTDFHDRPFGYKGHTRPTPYLGGAAVLLAFLLAAFYLPTENNRLFAVLGAAGALWIVGTIDDRRALSPGTRVAAEAAAAAALWWADIGWSLTGIAVLDLLLTVVWIVGIVNAFNLLDNMDGAAGGVAVVSGAGIAALALVNGETGAAVLGIALAGACAGFLPYNLAKPARIFLGDGGSIPIGFVAAASSMAVFGADGGPAGLVTAALLVGVPVLDTSLILVSRRRREISVLTAGRDHLTHRLFTRLRSARAVTLSLVVAQLILSALALASSQLGDSFLAIVAVLAFAAGVAAIATLESKTWVPETAEQVGPEAATTRLRRRSGGPTGVEIGIALAVAAICGVTPFLNGVYDLSVWGPVAVALTAILLALLIARPASPSPAGLVAVVALAALWLFSLLSTQWAESADQALVEADRWFLYATLFAILLMLLKSDQLGRIVLGAATAAVLGLAAYLVIELSVDGRHLFLGGRLNEPFGYVNGEAAYLLLGFWPLVAVAERVRRLPVAAAAVGGATLLAGLVLLSETRSVLPALLVSSVFVVAAVPGRTKRLWILIVVIGGVTAVANPLIDVYSSLSPDQSAAEAEATIRDAVRGLVLASVGAALVWGLAGAALRRVSIDSRHPIAIAGVVAVLAMAGAGAVATIGDPVDAVRTEWHNFKGLKAESGERVRLVSGAGNRYDYWRVAVEQFKDQPLRGIGAGNYDTTYFRERRTPEDIRQPHSLELQVLGELGLVGGAILLTFLAAIMLGLASRVRRARVSQSDATIAVAAGGLFIAWLVHTSVDWLHLMPGVTGVALCAAAVLVGRWRSMAVVDSPRRLLVTAFAGLVLLFGGVLVARPTLALHYTTEGQSVLERDPAQALTKSRDALALNGDALPSYYLEAAAFARQGNYFRARASLLEATRKEPSDYVTWLLLGDLAVRRGEFADAKRYYGRASSLNPRDVEVENLARDPRLALQPSN